MKLLFCSEFFYPSIGGVQEVMRHIATRMVKAGHEVTVATSFLAERVSNEHSGITIKPFAVAGNAVNGMIGEVDEYRRFLLESDFDVLFVYAAQQWTFDALWKVLPDLQMHKVVVPCGYSGLAEASYREYFQKLPAILAQFDAIVYHARNYRDYEFGKKHGLEERAVVIPNGADDQEFSTNLEPGFRERMAISEGALVLLTVGSMNGAKGHLEVAQAFEQLDLGGNGSAVLLLNGNRMPSQVRDPSARARIREVVRFLRTHGPIRSAKIIVRKILMMLGVGLGYFAALDRCVARVNRMRDRKIIVCDLARPDLIQAFFLADLYVFASYIEYSPLVLYEACAAGTPFLSLSVGNASEIAEWTQGGEVLPVEPNERGLRVVSPTILAAQIKRLLENKPRLEELGASGRQAWQERFNWNALAQEYMRLFERVCAEGEKRGEA